MRVGLNLLPVVPGIGGAWRYVQNVLTALGEHDAENEFIAFATEDSAELIPRASNFHRVLVPLYARSRPLRVAFENTVFPMVMRRYELDCTHHFFGTLPWFVDTPTVVSVFDLMVFERPHDFGTIKRMYLKRWRRRAAARASVLAPMSYATAESLHHWMDVPNDRMIVIPPVVPAGLNRPPAAKIKSLRKRLDLPPQFWLCVAGPYPHKNVERLIEAIAILRERGAERWPLVIRGDPRASWLAHVRRCSLEGNVRFVEWLSDEDMRALYAAASALVFPSLFEGGGLPVLEAMACGCPIVASDLPTTREYAGDAAVTFDPTSPTDIARAMGVLLESPGQREMQVKRGHAGLRPFAPRRVVRELTRAYRQCVVPRGMAGSTESSRLTTR